MAIPCTSCSTSNYLSEYDARLRSQSNETELVLADEKNKKRQAAEFIFRGELLEQAEQNNGFRPQKEEQSFQSIDPENQLAISNYESNNGESASILSSGQGQILDAYA